MNKAYLIFVIVLISLSAYSQRITVDRNGKNPHLHAFSLHQLPALFAHPGSNNRPYYVVFTFFGDGVFSRDTIFSGTPHDDRYGFSSPVTYTENLYPSASNYAYISLLRSYDAVNEIELLMKGSTIKDMPLKQNEGMCNPIPDPSVMAKRKIRLISNSMTCDSGQYLGLIISFLTHSDNSKIELHFDNSLYSFEDKIIPNIVQSIAFNEAESTLNTSEEAQGKLVFDIKKIPTFTLSSSYELRIAVFFKKLVKSPEQDIFNVVYLNEMQKAIDTNSLIIQTQASMAVEETIDTNIPTNPIEKKDTWADGIKAYWWIPMSVILLLILLLRYRNKKVSIRK